MDSHSPDRLCEYDLDAQSGCYRTCTILAFEGEYNTIVHPEMKWGAQNMYFQHEGSIFYSRSKLVSLYEDDAQNILEDNNDIIKQNNKTVFEALLGHSAPHNRFNPEFIKNIIKIKPKGLPRFINYTKNFYQFEDVCVSEITADTITKSILDKIQETFTDDYNPLLTSLDEGLYQKDGNIYMTDLTKWGYNPAHKLGVFINPITSDLYGTEKTLFFPFNPLSESEIEFVITLNALESAPGQTGIKEVRIITL